MLSGKKAVCTTIVNADVQLRKTDCRQSSADSSKQSKLERSEGLDPELLSLKQLKEECNFYSMCKYGGKFKQTSLYMIVRLVVVDQNQTDEPTIKSKISLQFQCIFVESRDRKEYFTHPKSLRLCVQRNDVNVVIQKKELEVEELQRAFFLSQEPAWTPVVFSGEPTPQQSFGHDDSSVHSDGAIRASPAPNEPEVFYRPVELVLEMLPFQQNLQVRVEANVTIDDEGTDIEIAGSFDFSSSNSLPFSSYSFGARR